MSSVLAGFHLVLDGLQFGQLLEGGIEQDLLGVEVYEGYFILYEVSKVTDRVEL